MAHFPDHISPLAVDAMSDTELVRIDQILIGARHRQDMGDIDALAASISSIGLMHPIVLTRTDNGLQLVAGERRTTAYRHLGRDSIPARILDIDEIVVAEQAENEMRKDFTVSERVAIGRAVEARIGKRRGQRTDRLSQQIGEVSKGRKTDSIAAAKAGFGNAETYRLAKIVTAKGVPELIEAVDADDVSIAAAADIASAPLERQREFIKTRGPDGKLTPEAKSFIKEVRAENQIKKKRRRDDREAELGRKLLAMPEQVYGVAIEDFEWDHEPWSRDSGMDRHPSNHYPTAADAHTPEEIVARTADRLKCLAPDAVLYMWTTIPHSAIAYRVLELRGFRYVTQRVWGKLRNGKGRGPGYWVTGEHEILLIGVRGKVVPPATAHFPSFFTAPVGAHSAKPAEQYKHAEFHFPSLPKIELNARAARPGWDRWGLEAPDDGEVDTS